MTFMLNSAISFLRRNTLFCLYVVVSVVLFPFVTIWGLLFEPSISSPLDNIILITILVADIVVFLSLLSMQINIERSRGNNSEVKEENNGD